MIKMRGNRVSPSSKIKIVREINVFVVLESVLEGGRVNFFEGRNRKKEKKRKREKKREKKKEREKNRRAISNLYWRVHLKPCKS